MHRRRVHMHACNNAHGYNFVVAYHVHIYMHTSDCAFMAIETKGQCPVDSLFHAKYADCAHLCFAAQAKVK